LRFEPLDPVDPIRVQRRPSFYLLLFGLFLCALLSKTVTCTLPVIIGVLIWWKHGRIGWKQILALVPLLALGAGMGLGTAWLEKHSIGAQGSDFNLSLVERCLLAGKALWFYMGKLVYPVDLTFIYPRWSISAHNLFLFIYPLGFGALIATVWALRKRVGRGPVAALLVFSVTLFPALGFIDVFPFRYSYVADHFQYLASAGLMALAAAGIAGLDRLGRLVRPVLTGGLLGVLGLMTWTQAYSFTSLEALWRDTLEKNPEALIAHFNLGNLLAQRGKSSEAIEQYTACIRLQPQFLDALGNRAGLYAQKGEQAKAREDYAQAMKLALAKGDAESQEIIRKRLSELPPGP
jgi:tetratricopeptide (TPR) repeat protein